MENQIESLETKLKKDPSNPKAKIWKEQLKGLKARNVDRLGQAKTRDIVAMAQNTSSTNARVPSDGGGLLKSIDDYAASVIDADVGAVRTPDSCTENTALYHSVVQIPIQVDPTSNNGFFGGMVQCKLGADSSPIDYFIAIPNGSSNNFAQSSSFISNINGDDIRVDPETSVLISGDLTQNTFYGGAVWPAGINDINYEVTGTSGTNNSGYSFYPAGVFSPQLNFTPTSPVFIVPNGANFHALQIFHGNNVVSFNGGGGILSTSGGSTTVTLSLRKYDYLTGVDSLVDYFTVNSAWNAATDTYTLPTTNLLRFVNGGLCFDAIVNTIFSVTFYTEYFAGLNSILYLTINVSTPELISAMNTTLRWDVGTTAVNSLVAAAPGAILQKYRPVSQKVHFKCTLSDFNNSGQVALNLLQGGAQDTYFSTIGGNKLTFEALSNNNLPLRTYSGKLADGFYGFWVPDNLLDTQLKTYTEQQAYRAPFFAYAGNWTPTGAGAGLVTIGYLRVVTNYEITTVSRLLVTNPQSGTDSLMQAIQGSVAKLPKVMENPTHPNILKSMVSVMAKGAGDLLNIGKGAVMIGKSVGGLLATVGMM